MQENKQLQQEVFEIQSMQKGYEDSLALLSEMMKGIELNQLHSTQDQFREYLGQRA